MDLNLPRPRWRFTGVYRFNPRLQAGLEWNPNARELGFIGNYIVQVETEKLPMISLGTSSDRIGTPPGPHAYYATFAKSIPNTRIAPYASINYSEHDRKLNVPFGINFSLAKEWDALFMNDGRKSHALLTYKTEAASVSLIWVWLKHPGVSVSFGF